MTPGEFKVVHVILLESEGLSGEFGEVGVIEINGKGEEQLINLFSILIIITILGSLSPLLNLVLFSFSSRLLSVEPSETFKFLLLLFLIFVLTSAMLHSGDLVLPESGKDVV